MNFLSILREYQCGDRDTANTVNNKSLTIKKGGITMFKKGKSGNANGRPKGAKDKKKSSLLEKVQCIVDSNMDTIQQDIDQLEPSERIRAITGLINYVLPKQQSATPMEMYETEYSRLELLLQNAPDEAINEIVTRIERLKIIEHGNGRKTDENTADNE